MRRSIVFLLSLLVLLLLPAFTANASAFVSTGDGAWPRQNPLPHGNPVAAIDFLGASIGWVLSGQGACVSSATWTRQEFGARGSLRSVSCVSAKWLGLRGGGWILRTAIGRAPGFWPVITARER